MAKTPMNDIDATKLVAHLEALIEGLDELAWDEGKAAARAYRLAANKIRGAINEARK